MRPAREPRARCACHIQTSNSAEPDNIALDVAEFYIANLIPALTRR